MTRHSLTLFCSDSQILAQLYKQQLADLDQEPYHAHLRYLPFDLSLRLPADKNLDYFVTKIRENSGGGERCGGGALKLAVKELDEKHVGVFSFRSREGINKVGVAHFITVMAQNLRSSISVQPVIILCSVCPISIL